MFQRTDHVRTRVTQPTSPWTVPLGLAGCAALGLIVFASLSNARQATPENPARPLVPAQAPGPAPAVAMAAPPGATFAPPTRPASPAILPVADPLPADPSRRWRSPAMVVDLSESAGAGARPAANAAADPAAPDEAAGVSAEESFAARVSSGGVETARATRLRDMALVAPQGTVIPGVLETAINSDLPGSVRAVVSQDVRGFDGSTVLIPRGSKLIGQYRSGVALGGSRAFVVWSRILTPEGVSIDVGSPATDPLGRGGLAGKTDTHFLSRFGGAILLTVLNAGAEALARQGGSSTAVIIGAPDQAGRLAGVVPQGRDIPITVKVAQGTPLQVFVTRDLDFSGLAPRP